jgi:protein ImuB
VQRRLLEQPDWRSVPLFVCRLERRGVMTVVSWFLPPQAGGRTGRMAQRGAGPGIMAGMPLAEAMDVMARSHGAQICRSAMIDPDDPTADRESLAVLARWCRRFSPLVAVESGIAAAGGIAAASSRASGGAAAASGRASGGAAAASGRASGGRSGEPECIQLDVSGTAGFFGGETRLARLAVWALAGRGLHARVAIADTPAASWAAAHHTSLFQAGHPQAGRPGAGRPGGGRPGGDRAGQPGGRRVHQTACRFVVVPPGEAATLLAPLPPTALRLATGDLLRLAELGIDTIGGVLRLPRAGLAARFSGLLSRRLAEFTGAIAEPLEPPAADELPQARHAWEAPVLMRDMPREALDLLMQRLIAECVAPLAAAGRGITALQVRLERPRWCGAGHGGSTSSVAGSEGPSVLTESERPTVFSGSGGPTVLAGSGGPTVIDVGLYRPSVAVGHLVDLVRLRMARTPLPREIDGITVEVLAAGQAVTRQRFLFTGGAEVSRSQVGMLLDRLSGRLGRRAVFAPRLVADAQPEHAWMPVPPVSDCWAGGASGGAAAASGRASGGATAASGRASGGIATVSGRASGGAAGPQRRSRGLHGDVPVAPQRRPVWLVPRPRRVEVMSVVPDGPPVRFRWQSQWLRIARAQGAERIETAWWRGPCVRRDYWIVEVESGERYWLFRRLTDGAWFLHGLFA